MNANGVQTTQTFTATATSARINVEPQITSVPDGPAIVGQTYVYDIVAFDPNGDNLQYGLVAPVDGVAVDPTSGRLTFDPTTAGSVSIAIEVIDVDDQGQPYGGSATQTFTLPVVQPPGSIPEIVSSPVGPAAANQQWIYTVRANDDDGDAITIALDPADVTSNTGIEAVSF